MVWRGWGLLCGVAMVACGARAEPCPPDEGTCWGAPAPAGEAWPEGVERSVLARPLASCSTQPLTGFFRDGLCRTGPRDAGVHVVCAEVDKDFLTFTAAQGNDLSTPRAGSSFPGLKPGDRWCLCAARWEEARVAGHAPRVVLEATHEAALKHVTLDKLQKHEAPGS